MAKATRQLVSHTVREEDHKVLPGYEGNTALILIMIMISFHEAAEVEGDQDLDA